jgi:hypothetical protein
MDDCSGFHELIWGEDCGGLSRAADRIVECTFLVAVAAAAL